MLKGMPKGSDMLVGPHVSIAGELANAIANGERVGATAIQIFTANQRAWVAKPYTDEVVERWQQAWRDSAIREVMSHGSYLVNLGSPEPEKLGKSRRAFCEEARRCARLGIRLLNFHPGARMGSERAECLERIAESVRMAMDEQPDAAVIYVIENTAGQGSVVGETLEDLAQLLELIDGGERVGVCLDTCHLFAAGYDIRSEEGWTAFWQEFEGRIGLKHLRAFHLNDAKKPLGSRVDRHEAIGEGHIGAVVFQRLAADSRFDDVPMFLETPGPEEVWEREVTALRAYRSGEPETAP